MSVVAGEARIKDELLRLNDGGIAELADGESSIEEELSRLSDGGIPVRLRRARADFIILLCARPSGLFQLGCLADLLSTAAPAELKDSMPL